MKQQILDTISQLKHNTYKSIAIPGQHNEIPFSLYLLTNDTVDDLRILRRLARWRKKHEEWFPSQFPITIERTRIWLKDRVLHEPDRLLFLLQVKNAYIGHIGLYRFDFEHQTCEIDNIVRGIKGYPGIMETSIQSMMEWGKEIFHLRGYTLETTSDNKRAIKLYKSLQFYEKKRIPMIYKKNKEGGVWEAAPDDYNGTIKRYTVFMSQL